MGPELADELRRVGAEIKKQAEKELAEFYPPDLMVQDLLHTSGQGQ